LSWCLPCWEGLGWMTSYQHPEPSMAPTGLKGILRQCPDGRHHLRVNWLPARSGGIPWTGVLPTSRGSLAWLQSRSQGFLGVRRRPAGLPEGHLGVEWPCASIREATLGLTSCQRPCWLGLASCQRSCWLGLASCQRPLVLSPLARFSTGQGFQGILPLGILLAGSPELLLLCWASDPGSRLAFRQAP
jgi:hypothetical protein